MYGVALAHALFGRSIWAIRLPTALASAGAVLTLFYAGCILFGTNEETNTPRPWLGIFIRGVSAALLAISLNHLALERLAFRANWLIFFASLSGFVVEGMAPTDLVDDHLRRSMRRHPADLSPRVRGNRIEDRARRNE